MITRISFILVIGLSLVSLFAQDNLPVYSAVQYEVRADSLVKTNQPQEVTISISCSSPGDLKYYELKIYDLKVLWTLVSATLNDQPIWLVNAGSKSENEKVLAWHYDSEQNLLRLFPMGWQSGYRLKVTVRASILQPALLEKTDGRVVILEAEVGGQKYQCSTTGSGGDMTFKRNLRQTR
jgi:hypothetical protein